MSGQELRGRTCCRILSTSTAQFLNFLLQFQHGNCNSIQVIFKKGGGGDVCICDVQ